jgi:hypothetical protein
MTVEAAEKTVVARPEQPVERSAVAVEADLSVPHEKRNEVVTATTLPPLTVVDRALSDGAVSTAASEVRKALETGIITWAKPDTVKTIIGPMNETDMRRLERSYDQPGQPAGQLRRELREKLSPAEFRAIEALLDRKDAKTNIVGNIATAIETANSGSGTPMENQDRAGRLLRASVATLGPEELAQVKKDWDARYGKEYGTFDDAIARSMLSDRDKALMSTFFSKGHPRSAEDIQAAAKLIVDGFHKERGIRNTDQALQQLSDVLGGDTPEAIAARRALQSNPEFMKTFGEAFDRRRGVGDTQTKVAKDLLSEGRISLSTIIDGNTRTLGRFFENPENISLALANATQRERDQFIAGRKLASENADPAKLTPDQKESLAFFQKLDAKFKESGDAREQAMWTDQLLNGRKGLISQMGELHAKPGMLDFWSNGSHSMEKLSSTVENMKLEDWNMLRPPKPGQESDYMKALKQSIAAYASPEEQKRLFELLDKKANAKSFAESQGIKRSFSEVVRDNPEGTPEARLAVASSLASISPADAAALKANPELQKQVAALFDMPSAGDHRDTAATVLGQSYLKQIAATGKQPVATALDKYSKEVMDGKLDDPGSRLAAVEKLMLENPELRARLAEIQGRRDQGGSVLASVSREDINLTAMMMSDAGHGYRDLLKGERVGIGVKIAMGGGAFGDGFKGHYGDIAKIQPDSERERLIGSLSPEMQQIARHVVKQGGTPDLADEAQSYLIGDGGKYQEFAQKIAQMSDAQRKEFYDKFKEKYGKDFKEAFVAGATYRDGLDEPGQKLLATLAKQDFKPTVADEMRALTLGGPGSYKDFEARLAQMDFEQRQKLKTEFSEKYGVDLAAAFLPKVEVGDRQKYTDLFTAAKTDPLSDYLNRMANFDTSGITPDGSRETVARSLQLNREILAEYSAARDKLPPTVRQALDNYYAEAVKQNLDARDKAAKAAEIAIEVTVIAAALASAPFTGGTSLGALSLTEAGTLITAAALAGGATRMQLISEIRGEGRMTGSDKVDQFKKGMIDGMLLASPLLFGRGGAVVERNPGRELTVVPSEAVAADVKFAQVLADARPVPALVADARTARVVVEARPAHVIAADVRAAEIAAEVRPAQALIADARAAEVVTAERVVAREAIPVKADVLPVKVPVKAADEVLPVVKPVKPENAGDDISDLFTVRDTATGRVIPAQVERLTPEAIALEKAAIDRPAKLAAERAAAEKLAAERVAAEKLAAERVAAERVAAEKLAAERAAAEKLAAERAAAEKLAAEQAAAREAEALRRVTPVAGISDAAALARIGIPGIAITDALVNAEVAPVVAPPAETVYKPSAKLIEAATVRRGEGPWQTAERILALDGKKHSVDEVRALTKAIQAAYKADNNSSDMSGLKVKYGFANKSEQTFNNIIANCKDDKVRALLISLAQK